MSSRKNLTTHNFSAPVNLSWSSVDPWSRDMLGDDMVRHQRRVRKLATAPAEDYHHPCEINGRKLLRKGKGLQPSTNTQELWDLKGGRARVPTPRPAGCASLTTAWATGTLGAAEVAANASGTSLDNLEGEAAPYRRLRAPVANTPQERREQLWAAKPLSRAKTAGPPDQLEQLWSTRGRKQVAGMSHADSGKSILHWDPSAQPDRLTPTAPSSELGRIGRRPCPAMSRSSIVLG